MKGIKMIIENVDIKRKQLNIVNYDDSTKLCAYLSTLLTTCVLLRMKSVGLDFISQSSNNKYTTPLLFWEKQVRDFCEDKIQYYQVHKMLSQQEDVNWYIIRSYVNQCIDDCKINSPKIVNVQKAINKWHMLSYNDIMYVLQDCKELLRKYDEDSTLIYIIDMELHYLLHKNVLKEEDASVSSVVSATDVAALPIRLFKNKLLRRMKKKYFGKEIIIPKEYK